MAQCAEPRTAVWTSALANDLRHDFLTARRALLGAADGEVAQTTRSRSYGRRRCSLFSRSPSLCTTPSVRPVAAVEQGARQGDSRDLERHAPLGAGGKQKDLVALGEVVRKACFDFLALQEVMTEEGLEQLRTSVETATNARWEAMASHAGGDSHKEMYAFLWNPAVIATLLDGAVVYVILPTASPASLIRRACGFDPGLIFVAANARIVHGETQGVRTAEMRALVEYLALAPPGCISPGR